MARIIAKFHPQAWVNDYAVAVDPEGPTECDVTDRLVELYSLGYLDSIRDDQYESDDLRFLDVTPQWWKDWDGPFYIEVRESIQNYLREVNYVG